MATTGFWPVRGKLKAVIEYAENPDKTTPREYLDEDLFNALRYAEDDEKTDRRMFVSGINCSKSLAYEQMTAVKQRFGERGKVVAYHGYQSFAAGEITPQEAHEIGIEIARRMWGKDFQIVVTTHLNSSNTHNHFIINATSFRNGRKFRNSIAQHREFREISDEVCRERGKSVLEHSDFYSGEGRGAYWAERKGKPTHRDMLKRDLEYCLDCSGNWEDFAKQMHGLGYYIDWQRMTVKAKDWERAVRLDRLGYSDEVIESWFEKNWDEHPNFSLEVWNYNLPKKRKSVFLSSLAHQVGWDLEHDYHMEEMLIDLVLLIIIEALRLLDTAKNAVILSVELRHCIKDIEQFVSDHRFLKENSIRTFEQLDRYIAKTKLEIEHFEHERSLIRNKIRHETDKTVLAENKVQRSEITREHIAPLRNKLDQAKKIRDISPHLCELLKAELEMERPFRRYVRDGRIIMKDEYERTR